METEKLELVSALTLNRIFGFEPKIPHSLIENLGSARAAFRLDREEKLAIFGPCSKFSPLLREEELEVTEKEMDMLSGRGTGFLYCKDSGYPDLLRECEDAPIVLYVRSSTAAAELFNKNPNIAVVGTRDISPYGRYCCEGIVSGLADAMQKPLIVSGMALGVDITAHLSALACGLPTIGVLPTGIDEVYPRRHRVAADKICSTPGCALVTDYPPDTMPVAANFLRRNRIIAGMSMSTILVESKIRGGGMMTAKLASSYGREVFCPPGRVDDLRSEGCNFLIRNKIAEALTSFSTVAEDLGLGLANRRRKSELETELREHYASSLSAEEISELLKIGLLIKSEKGLTIEEIGRSLKIDHARALRWTMMLESDGFISMDVLQRCWIRMKF